MGDFGGFREGFGDVPEEWGDFSHWRPVSAPAEPARGVYLGSRDPATASAVARTLAANYFDLGYDTIGWKVTEGTGYEDPTWASAYVEARQRGKRFVGYHFDRAANSGGVQFDWFIGRWRAVAGDLRPGLDVLCLDSEDTDTPGNAANSMRQFVARAIQLGYPTGLIYSGAWYANPNGIRLDAVPDGWAWGWLSDYTAGEPDTAIQLPAGWARERVVARQYTSTRPWPGQPAGVDFNRTLTAWPTGGGDWFDMATLDDLRQAVKAELAAAFPPAGGLTDNIGARAMVYVRDRAGLATSAQAVSVAGQVAAVKTAIGPLLDDETAIVAAVTDKTSLVLGALAALDTGHWTDAERQEFADWIAGQLAQVDADAILTALGTKLTTTPPTQ